MAPQRHKPTPPKWLDRLLGRFCAPHLLEEVLGDLHERYALRVQKVGETKARRRYYQEVLAYLRPSVIKRQSIYSPKPIPMDMFRNHFKIAFRNLRSKKVYSSINILGLAIGLACCLLIFQYVSFEYSFDTFNEHEATLYRIVQTTRQSGGEPDARTSTGWAMAPALAQEVPEVVRFTRLHPEYYGALVTNPAQPDKAFEEEHVFYADSSFFQMFTYPLVVGNPARALASGTVILSEATARKYFGDEDPLGQSLDVKGWINETFRVDGIFENVPANSHLRFDMLLPMADLLEKSDFSDADTGWGWTNFITYVQLHQDANLPAVEQKFTDVLMSNRQEDWQPTNTTGQLSAQPLLDVHLNEDIRAFQTVTGSYQAVYFFTIIGLVILLIALVNYVNLTTARALDRAREVGVRKVVGAKREQLVTQFLTESVFVILLSFALAVVLAEVFRPMLNELAGLNLTDALWASPGFWVALFTLFCATALLAGLYPALALSSFRPVAVLKGRVSRATSGAWLRRGLVIGQFTATIVLLIGITVVYTQLNHMRSRDLGINLEQIITVASPRAVPEGIERPMAIENFIQELRQLSAVRQTATSTTVPGKGFSFYTSHIRRAAADPSTEIDGVLNWIDTSFTTLYGLQLIAGEGLENITVLFPEEEPTPIIVNETAVRALGFNTSEEALNEEIDVSGNMSRIVGVLRDFNWSSAHSARANTFFFPGKNNQQVSIKVGTGNLPETIAAVEQLYQQLFPGNPFQYAFADETFDAQYREDQQFAKLISVFTVLAIIIACLGLFGLAAFTAEQRTKEIGVRKVLGASVAGIVSLLAKNFVGTVALSFLLASPLAWYAMNQWLQDFDYRIDIEWWMFAVSGTLVLLIALLTVSFQSIKAALANPVDSLRNE